MNATQQVGGSLGIALLNTVAAPGSAGFLAAQARGPGRMASERIMPVAALHGYVRAFEVSAAMIAVAFVLTVALVRRTPPVTSVQRHPIADQDEVWEAA
ncbi:MAG: hypothetical protein ACRDVW_08740 [Acidimicrobiales bacterium]